MPKRAALYNRASSEEQARHGLSLGEQRADLLNYAKEHGYSVVGIYADEGVSARKAMSRRKELQRMLADVEAGRIDIIIIKCLDRWFRNVADFYKVKERLDACGVDWVCSREDYNTTTPNGILMLNLKLSIAQHESDQTGERIRYVFEGKRARRQFVTGLIPLGLKVADGYFARDDKTAPIVECAFNHILSGGSTRSLVQVLYDKFGHKITKAGLFDLLRNRSYIGEVYGIPDYMFSLIPHDVFFRVQEILSRNTKYTHSGRIYLFSGLLRCPDCGRNLAAYRGRRVNSDGERRFQYQCGYRVNRSMPGCHFARGMYEDKIEQYLLDNIQSLIREHIITMESFRGQQGRERPELKIDALKAKLSRLEDIYIAGLMDKDKYTKTYKEITQEISELSTLVARSLSIPSALREVADDRDFRSTYESLTRENKQRFWKSIIASITFDDTPDTRGKGAYIPYRVTFL